MKAFIGLSILLFVGAANGAPKSVVCTFSDKVISGVMKSQRVPRTTVNCSNKEMNDDLRVFSQGPNPKTKAELVEYLLTKDFEIKTDNIMVQKPKPVEKDDGKVIKL